MPTVFPTTHHVHMSCCGLPSQLKVYKQQGGRQSTCTVQITSTSNLVRKTLMDLKDFFFFCIISLKHRYILSWFLSNKTSLTPLFSLKKKGALQTFKIVRQQVLHKASKEILFSLHHPFLLDTPRATQGASSHDILLWAQKKWHIAAKCYLYLKLYVLCPTFVTLLKKEKNLVK